MSDHLGPGGWSHPGDIDTCQICEDRPRFPGLETPYSVRVRYMHSIESEPAPGWQYYSTTGEGPKGGGWVLNVDAGEGGQSIRTTWYGATLKITHWRRYVGEEGKEY